MNEVRSPAKSLARILDSSFKIPGTNIRFGLDPIIGLVPGLGEWITSILSSYIVYEAYRDGVSRATLVRMVINIIIDSGIGAIPIIGDWFDLLWHSNNKNIALWERSAKRKSSGVLDFIFVVSLIACVLAVSTAIVYLILTGMSYLIGEMRHGIK